MRARKERLTVTIDRDLIEVAEEAVAMGEADSVSAWVNAALSEKANKERRLRAAARAIAAYEAEFGVITGEEHEAPHSHLSHRPKRALQPGTQRVRIFDDRDDSAVDGHVRTKSRGRWLERSERRFAISGPLQHE